MSKPPLILNAAKRLRQLLAEFFCAATSSLIDGARSGKLCHKDQLLPDSSAKVSPPWLTAPSSSRPPRLRSLDSSAPTVHPCLALRQLDVQPAGIRRQCENFSSAVDTAPISCRVLCWSTTRGAPRTPSSPCSIARSERDGAVRNSTAHGSIATTRRIANRAPA